jgi:hypothetical protein
LLPAGIAIYDAQQRGFPSVAHWLQAQLMKEKNPAAAAPAATKPVSSSNSNASSQGEAEVATAAVAAAAASKPGAKSLARGKKGAAGAEPEAAVALVSSQESRQDAAVAPGTPQKGFEAPTPGPAAAEKGEAAGRTKRGAAKAAAVMVAAVPAGKRVCAGGSAGTRKSLRFKH